MDTVWSLSDAEEWFKKNLNGELLCRYGEGDRKVVRYFIEAVQFYKKGEEGGS